MRFTLFGAPVRISPLLLLSVPLMLVLGIRDLISPAAAVFAHECGHILAAKYVKEPVAELNVYPFGAAIRMARPLPDRTAEFFVSLTGPAFSLLFATVAAGVMHYIPQAAFLNGFAFYSLFLCAVNLLPAFPLDGGRMLRAVLSAFCSENAASRIASALGIAVSVILAAAGMVGWPDVNFSALFFALFLFFGAILAKRETTPPVAAIVLRSSALSQRGAMRLSTVAAVSDMPVRAALTRLHGASLLAVVDHSFRLLGTLAEGDLLQGMISRGPDVTLEELLKSK